MGEPARPRETLLRYLRVQSISDAAIRTMLNRAAADVRTAIINSAPLSFSDAVRLSQLAATRAAILNTLWLDVAQEVVAGRGRAVTAAEDDGLARLGELLRGLPRDVREALLESTAKASRLAVDRAVAREAGVGRIPLAQSVYRNAALSNGAVDRLITSGIARNLSARSLAAEVARFIRPDVRGGVSYAALRLSRTEINNSFHLASQAYWTDNPFVPSMRWHLSGSHPKPDECNAFASANGGTGLFPVREVPAKPHPQCLCYTTPESLSDDEIVEGFAAGQFDGFMDRVAA